MLELSCQRVVKKKAKASFIYYSEFLALQKSSGEKKLIHKSFGPKKKLYKKERVLFLGASADFLFSREGWIVFYTDDYTQQFGRYVQKLICLCFLFHGRGGGF